MSTLTLPIDITEDGAQKMHPISKERLRKFCKGKKKIWCTFETREPRRSGQQNNALHLWFGLLADALNDGGYSVKEVLAHKMDIDWDGNKVKELLWRPAQQAILGKKSTTELRKTEDIDRVYDHLTRHLGEKFGVQVDFPSHEIGYWESAPMIND